MGGAGAVAAQPRAAQAPPLEGLPSRLLRERNEVREVLGARWWEALLLSAGRWVLDYLTLLAALTAVHARPAPVDRAARLLRGPVPGHAAAHAGRPRLRRGGPDGNARARRRAGAGAAVVATLAYRLVSFWLPIPAGGVAALLHKRLYGAPRTQGAVVSDAAGR